MLWSYLLLCGADVACNALVAEPKLLCKDKEVRAHGLGHLDKLGLKVDEVLELPQEPSVDVGQLVHLLHTVATVERNRDRENTAVAVEGVVVLESGLGSGVG